jgi:hypothetical protein
MTQVEKASHRLQARNIGHDIMGEAIVLNVRDIDLEEVYEFLISKQEIEYYANEYDFYITKDE